MANKILFCATVDYHFKLFHLPYLQWFAERGWEVHVAANGQLELPFVHHKHNLPMQRSPLRSDNMKAYHQLRKLIEKHRFQLIHCHTPMGGVLARLAARKAREKQRTKVIYTAHGFHFFRGGSLMPWLMYYPLEKWLSHHTDCLITINEEDYELAKQHRFKAAQIEHVHGVGVSTARYEHRTKHEVNHLRARFGFDPDHFLLVCTAELNKNKNQQLLIRMMAKLINDTPQAQLLLIGEGVLRDRYKQLAVRLGVSQYVHFLGYRDDVPDLLAMSDVAVSASLREGLPVSIMEAMCSRLPIVATSIRGHRELITDGRNGFLIAPQDVDAFTEKVKRLAHHKVQREAMGLQSIKAIERYKLEHVNVEMERIYSQYGGDLYETQSQYHRAYI